MQLDYLTAHESFPNIFPYRVVEFGNGRIVKGNYEFIYEDSDETRLKILRDQENLDDVISKGASEFDRIVLLRTWVRSQWEHTTPDPYPPRNALIHLDWIRKGKTGGFCGNFANVFIHCCTSLGIPARMVSINRAVRSDGIWRGGHAVAEVWSSEYRKWVVMDVDYDVHYIKNGIPQNALELHNHFIQKEAGLILPVEGSYLKFRYKPLRVYTGIYDFQKTKLLDYYYNLAVVMGNNFLSEDRMTWRSKVMRLDWMDERALSHPTRDRLLGSSVVRSNRVEDFYWTLNEVKLTLHPSPKFSETACIKVQLETFTPNFDRFLLKVNDGAWFEVKACRSDKNSAEAYFEWRLGEGVNFLQAKVRNKLGVEGYVSKVKIVSGPPFIPADFILKWGGPDEFLEKSWLELGFPVPKTRDGKFRYPSGIAVDNDGFVYVTDRQNHRIQKFTDDGRFIDKWGSEGGGHGQFKYPHGIIASDDGFIYVADMGNCRIQKFTCDGRFIAKWGGPGDKDGCFQDAHSIALDQKGFVYVTDSSYPEVSRVQKFTSDGEFVLAWGEHGNRDGQMHSPCGIAVDKDGFIYVADMGNCRIQKFTCDGKFIAKWGGKGTDDGQFKYPAGIAVDKDCFVYVVDSFNQCIQKFTCDGRFIAKWGGKGTDDGQFENPHAITVDSTGFLYVVDSWLACIQKFKI